MTLVSEPVGLKWSSSPIRSAGQFALLPCSIRTTIILLRTAVCRVTPSCTNSLITLGPHWSLRPSGPGGATPCSAAIPHHTRATLACLDTAVQIIIDRFRQPNSWLFFFCICCSWWRASSNSSCSASRALEFRPKKITEAMRLAADVTKLQPFN